jgi:putative aldouronate transport system substrate-binding protein
MRDQQLVTDEVNRLLATNHPELNLSLEIIALDWGTYPDRLNLMLQTGEEFDVAFLCQWYAPYFGPVAARGDLYPLDDLLDQYGQDIKAKVTDPAYFQALSHAGKVYGVPNEQGYAQVKGLTFLADLVDKYNFDYKSVKTLKDVESYLQTIKENEPAYIPFLPGTAANDLVPPQPGEPEGVANGFSYNWDSNSLVARYETAKEKEYAQLIRDWYLKGYIAKDAASRIVWGDEIKSGQYAVMPNFGYLNDGIKTSADNGIRMYDVPTYTSFPIRTADIQNGAVSISKSSKHPDRAMQMINVVWADQQIYNTIIYGVEGTHWNFTDAAKTEVEITEEGSTGYGDHPNYQVAGLINLFGRADYPRAQMIAEVESNKTAVASKLMGFSYDGSNVENETAAYNAIISEVSVLIDTGTVDPEPAIADLNARLEGAGLQVLKDDLAKQINEWRAANGK